MMPIRFPAQLPVLVFLGILLSGCGIINPPQAPTPFPDAAYTAAAQTIIAQLTQSAPPTTAAPLPTDTATAILTEAPSATAPAEETPTPPATGTPTGEAAATETITPGTAQSPPGNLVFEDDFSDETGWFTDQGDNFGFEYARDGYRIYVNIMNATIWSIRERDSGDVGLEVDAVQTSGAEDGYFGLVCRHQDEEESYYALVISSDGTFGIGKSEDGEFEFLETGTAPEGLINPQGETNRVRADCLGDTLSLYANGQKLQGVQDDDFDSGYVGLVAGTRLSGDVTVLFDNFAIYEP